MFINKSKILSDTLKAVEYYYEQKDEVPVYPKNIFEYIGKILSLKKNEVIIINNRLLCGGTRVVLKKRCDMWNTVKEFAIQYRALEEAMSILNRRGVACYFFNRPGKLKGFVYQERAQYRMKHKLNFPKMLQNPEKYHEDWSQLIGDKYCKGYIEKLSQIPQIIKKDNIFVHQDLESELINVKNGKRITIGQPQSFKSRVYVYGRCGAFGYAVSDSENIPSQLQQLFLDNKMDDYAVINQGLWGANDSNIIHNFLFDVSEFREGDIVIFYLQHFDFKLIEKLEKRGMWFYNLTEPWHKFDDSSWCFYDKPGHMNDLGYKNVAKLIFDYIKDKDFMPRETQNEETLTANYLNEYLKNLKDVQFEENINAYLDKIRENLNSDVLNAENGAIVMNCNPFTLGHRYLIEKASKDVDNLFIFVVEEDRSFFKFQDRFQMVKDGTRDIDNVIVVPSGKFIISTLTFPEYFLKDYVKEKDFDVSNDVGIFCKYIAAALGIKKRFAGEEPFDPVTNNYNCEMKKLLPDYNMEFVEIPRALTSEGEVINATKVRTLLNQGNIELLSRYLPETTISILKRKYVKR